MKTKLLSVILILITLSLCVITGCKDIPQETTGTPSDITTGDEPSTQAADTETAAETDAETEEIIVDEEPVFYEKTERDPFDPENVDVSGADWNGTIANANEKADGVQAKFTDAGRKKFFITNKTCSLLYDLSTEGKKQVEAIYNADGKLYFNNPIDITVTDNSGKKYSAAFSVGNGRMNSHRLGFYYYDFRFCDQTFISEETIKQMNENDEYFDIIANSGNWGRNDTSKVVKKDGVLSFTIENIFDPYIRAQVKFSAEEYDAVQITMKAEYSTNGNVYIAAGAQTGFNAEQHTDFKLMQDAWTTVVVPLSHLPDYNGFVTAFRIDVGSQAGEKVEIKEIKAIKRGNASVPFALERIFHTYSDKMHEVVRIVATADYDNGGALETAAMIPADTVRKLVIKDKNGEKSELSGIDFDSVEYVGFDIKGVGIYGVIMPAVDNNGYIKVEEKDGNYVITRGIAIKEGVKKGEDVLFGHRIYTTDSHQFNDLRKEAYIERNPLQDVFVVKKVDGADFDCYDALVGCYRFKIKGSDFNRAYYKEPDKHYELNALICGDGVADRQIYIQTREPGGQLECAAILDENNVMLPLPLEVGKNFKGEYEEKLFDPDDTSYGEVYLPVTVKKDENKRFTLLHLYQKWGNYPLKQLSFIAFHICYYHLSVGVTETNCIAPYFVYGKDGWTLPDFRANSAPLWKGQPQHTSAGRLYFLQYQNAAGEKFKSESQSADIASHGPVYADINMEYLSDDGKIKAMYRHAEMPQTDENRTYYTIKLEVLDDVEIADFKNDFSFFTFDGRSVTYSNVGYLDENGNPVVEKAKNGTRLIKLGKENPYYDYFGGNEHESVNFALIVLDSDITVGGKKYDGNFIFRDVFDGTLNFGSLTLDLGKTTLKKGDTLLINMILMPWGYSTSKDDHNVTDVRADSCADPYKLTVINGEAVNDRFIPSIKAKNNEASFKLSGGKNNCAVRVYGFEKYTAPQITVKADGNDTDFTLHGAKHDYDGYQVQLDKDGTYSFSFVLNMDNAEEYEITVKQ